MPSSKPGRCQGSQASLWPNSLLNSSILILPLAEAARAMPQSGWRWSTCGKGRKPWSGRVDGGGDGVVAEGAERVHVDHLVFEVDAAVGGFEGEELVEIEGGEAGALDAAEVAAASLHPEDLFGLAVEGVDLVELGAGVAAAEVGDAQIGAEQVGAIAQKLGTIEGCGDGFIPSVFEKAEACMHSHFGFLFSVG